IGRGLGDLVGADVAAGARYVLDDRGGAGILEVVLCDQSAEEVGRAAGRKRHNERYVFLGVGLLRHGGGADQHGGGCQAGGKQGSASLLDVLHGVLLLCGRPVVASLEKTARAADNGIRRLVVQFSVGRRAPHIQCV